MEKSNRFIRVTKDNRKRDRGIIAIDSICAAFENQESHKTEIMTLDGFWYEVMDGIEDVYSKLVSCETDIAIAPAKNKEADVVMLKPNSPSKSDVMMRRKVSSPAIAEDKEPKNHEQERNTRRGEFAYPKKGYGYKRQKPIVPNAKNLPSSEGEGHYDLNPRSEHIPPQIGL